MPTIEETRKANANLNLGRIVAIVAGGTSGIGAGVALKIAEHSQQPEIHLIGRNQAGADAVVAKLKAANPAGSYIFHKCDVSLLANVKALLATLKPTLTQLNFLVLSCGILPSIFFHEYTSEGHDVALASSLYSRFLMARELAPVLQRTSESGQRAVILHVFNATQSNVKKVDFDDLGLQKSRGFVKAMALGFTMGDLYLQDIAKRYPGVATIHTYPGFVKTPIARNRPFIRFLGYLGSFFHPPMSPETCGEFTLHALADPANKAGTFSSINDDASRLTNVPQPTDAQRQQMVDHLNAVFDAVN